MKILVHEAFDFRFPSRAMIHCQVWPEPYTVKREIGEHGVALGRAVEIGANGKPVTKRKKPANAGAHAQTPDLAGDSAMAGINGHLDSGRGIRVPGDDGPGQ